MQTIMSNKVEILYEKEKLSKLLTDVENENQEIARLLHELEVERKALSIARYASISFTKFNVVFGHFIHSILKSQNMLNT